MSASRHSRTTRGSNRTGSPALEGAGEIEHCEGSRIILGSMDVQPIVRRRSDATLSSAPSWASAVSHRDTQDDARVLPDCARGVRSGCRLSGQRVIEDRRDSVFLMTKACTHGRDATVAMRHV